MLLRGRCHCGNLRYEFETAYAPAELPLRICQCSFCRAHGAVNATDPRGRLRITTTDSAKLRRYRFGLGITDFLICADCGVYLTAVAEIDGRWYASLNVSTLEVRGELKQEPRPVEYGGETVAERRTRRKQGWTPAEFG